MAGHGHKDHPLNILVGFTLGSYPNTAEEREFRRRLAHCRDYFDRDLKTDRERRFVLQYVLARCDAVEAARAANLLPDPEETDEPGEDGRPRRWTTVDYETASRKMRRRPHVDIFLRELVRLCRLDKPDRGIIVAEMMGVIQKPVMAREKLQAATVILKLCPDLAVTDATVEKANLLKEANRALTKADGQGRLRRTGQLASLPADDENGANGARPAHPPSGE